MKILIVEDHFIEAYDLQLILQKAGYTVTGIAHSVIEAEEAIALNKPDIVCLDIFLDDNETGIDLAKRLKQQHIGFIYISANSGKSILEEVKTTQPYGFIIKPFRDQDVITTLEIASYRHTHNAELLQHGLGILQQSLDAISFTAIKWNDALLQLGKAIQSYIPFDYMDAGYGQLPDNVYDTIGLFRRNFDDYTLIDAPKFAQITIFSLSELSALKKDAPQLNTPVLLNNQAYINFCQQSALHKLTAQSFGLKSMLAVPIMAQNSQLFTFTFYSKQQEVFTAEHFMFIENLQSTLARYVNALFHFSSGKALTTKKTLPAVAKQSTDFEGMIGNSKKMLIVFDHIKKVAPSNTSVLILGESGTGKEKVAHSIHNLSTRKDKSFIVVNCGAIPDNLAESILFGHEKGAFTGATEKKTGKFEMATNGTIFLDEIAELPLSLQVKLLRVLQENEIERVGGVTTIPINARVIAATNKNLETEVAAGRFRMDLYYRLHVFPITMPALRERKEDIPALAYHFTELYSSKMGRDKVTFSNNVLEQIMCYDWPGNIRQLEHVIERSILLAETNTIKEILLPQSKNQGITDIESKFESGSIKTIYENERDYICYILKRCKGKVYGSGGAAELLDIPPSTLNSKIKKLGIKIKAF